jgi:hypothetical protein
MIHEALSVTWFGAHADSDHLASDNFAIDGSKPTTDGVSYNCLAIKVIRRHGDSRIKSEVISLL